MSNETGGKWNGMNWIRTSTRLALYAAHDFRCVYCASDAARGGRGRFGLDHKVARAAGGGNAVDNLAMACKGCNARKGNRDVDTYLAALAADGIPVAPIRARIQAARDAALDRVLGRALARQWEGGASLATLAKRTRARAA